ncbi:MAG: DUF1441 family protein [Hafnia sp.]|uniref:DUF1441 family protein n=1 Tax=Hafnia sp. TaxID=1873498 RepID=UPI002FC5DB38
MSNISNIGDVYHWSIAKIAEAFRLDRKVVKKRLLEANIPVAGKMRGNPVYALSDVGPALFAPQGCSDGVEGFQDPEKMMPKERKDWFDSEKGRIWLEEKQRLLIPESEVFGVYAATVKTTVQLLETLPDKLERDAGMLPKAVEVVQKVVDDFRVELAESTYQACLSAMNGEEENQSEE